MIWITLPLLCYLMGSIPFAVITGRITRGVDIREMGSGNAGATNVYRILGLVPGIIVLISDLLKAFIPLFIIKYSLRKLDILSEQYLSDLLMVLCLFSVLSGHVFPVFARFKGGKAVAAGAGGITALFPILSLLCLTAFLLTAWLTKYISLASLSASWSLPVFYTLLAAFHILDFSIVYLGSFIFIAFVITVLHLKNIKALINGSERKISVIS